MKFLSLAVLLTVRAANSSGSITTALETPFTPKRTRSRS